VEEVVPKYLEALGASTPIIGLYGTAEDFFDAIYQYPGGWLADHLGRRRAFLTFVSLATAGYLVFLLSPSWPFLFLGLALVMAWQSMASPAIFAVRNEQRCSSLCLPVRFPGAAWSALQYVPCQ
jgi:MFS family permease